MRNCLLLAMAIAILALVGCSKNPRVSDPLEAIIPHVKNMLKIVRENSENCEKILVELESYSKAHQAEFQAIRKASEDMEKNWTEEQKKEYQQRPRPEYENMVKEHMNTLMEINQKCPEYASKIASALRIVN